MQDITLQKMQTCVQLWEAIADRRSIFLRCYQMMTENMLAANEERQFQDAAWVDQLLRRFADYYFVALEQYDKNPELSPSVWQVAHAAARNPKISALQLLLLGVNAHINYDLVLTLGDVLDQQQVLHSPQVRQLRYADHCKVNEVIGQTIDAVQDQILEPVSPLLDWVDKLMGPVDEYLISALISNWRETVWQNAVQLIQIEDPETRKGFIQQVELDALRLGKIFN